MNSKADKSLNSFDGDPILQATWLYYQDGMNQSEISKLMKVSRVTIVKYLQVAREKGYVQINLDQKSFSSIDTAVRIKNKFDLRNVIIIPSAKQDAVPRERLAKAGAMYLNQVVQEDDVLGVAWGRTIHQMGNKLTPKPLNNVTVIQMLGSMPSQPDFTTIESSSQIASKFSGRCASLHVPAVVSNPRLAMELQAEPIIQANFSILKQCNKAFFMVGNSRNDNPLIRCGVLTEDEMNHYRELGAVGVICGRFYDINGNPVVSEVDLRILGISLAQLRLIKQRIFMACGEYNYEATYGAIIGGFVSDLIIDEATADFLLYC
ncbi:MAG: sugar-binding transcriptional regulator [Aliivibrio sp.]|uniref:sugar-binding transcriptional regulator n=1 Tax=Aliivibrio sp. TaxID=1872443 RepID=UPI001A55E036|nr:sugar-binding transcriptional regulator [Aliivibrio sp.]